MCPTDIKNAHLNDGGISYTGGMFERGRAGMGRQLSR